MSKQGVTAWYTLRNRGLASFQKTLQLKCNIDEHKFDRHLQLRDYDIEIRLDPSVEMNGVIQTVMNSFNKNLNYTYFISKSIMSKRSTKFIKEKWE